MTRTTYTLTRIALAVSLLGSTAVSAEMYRWTDKNGGVHYTQTPPPGFQAQTLAPPPPPAAAPTNLKKYADDYKKNEDGKSKSEADAQARQAQEQERQANCERARTALEKMRTLPPNRQAVTDESGNVTRMTSEQQAENMSNAQKMVADNCSG